MWVLTGMGGLGKSTMALALASSARARGWRVWWVTASSPASLTGGILEVLGQIGAPDSLTRLVREGEPTAPERAWEFITNSRVAGSRWLLVFDNADDPAVLAAVGRPSPADGTGWLRTGAPGMVLVTSRYRDPRTWGTQVQIRELLPLDDEVAAEVLTDLVPRSSEHAADSAQNLAHRLGGLPLALHLAGTYLASPFARWHSFDDYLKTLDSGGLVSALAELDDPAAETRARITRTWELSLDALTAHGREQSRPLLLLLCCYAADDPFPVALLQPELLRDILAPIAPASVPSAEDLRQDRARRLREGLSGLATMGLINVSGDGTRPDDRVVTVHPIVVDVNRSLLLTTATSELPAIGEIAVTVLRAACQGLGIRAPADWPAWRRVVPHIIALLDWLSPHLDEEPLVALATTAAMSINALWRGGNPIAAERLASAATPAISRLNPHHPASLAVRSQFAQAVALSRDAEAEQLFRQLIDDQQRVLGSEHPDTLTSRRLLARLAGNAGRSQQAEDMYRQLLADDKRILGEEHHETLFTRHGLAWAVMLHGRPEEAEPMFRSLLNDQRRILGDDHQECLAIRHGLARSLEEQHKYQDAEQMYRQLFVDDQRILGADHTSTLHVLQSLARIVAIQGRSQEARQLYSQLLADSQRVQGEDHPVTVAAREFLDGAQQMP